MTEGSTANSGDRWRWHVLAVIGIAQLMVVLDVTVMNIALPSAQRALGFSTVRPLRPAASAKPRHGPGHMFRRGIEKPGPAASAGRPAMAAWHCRRS
jgi:hypothetical protein